MREVTYADQAGMLAWAEKSQEQSMGSRSRFRPDAKAIGMARDGALIAVVVFDTWSPCSCSMHVASDGKGRWLNREYLTRLFAFAFIQARLRRVTALVPDTNLRALRFDLHIGFRHEGLLRHALPDGDLVVLGMLREECRWIPEECRHA
jgi:RimJ/RimL family protein N-acetyltransferase